MLHHLIIRITAALLLLTATAAHADSVLLVHGYLSGYATWRDSGTVAALESNGWQQAGVYAATHKGRVALYSAQEVRGEARRIWLMDLPSEAPVLLQADLIAAALGDIRKRLPGESITIVGHSAGAVAARAALVRHGVDNVTHMVSIAGPHLGTAKAGTARTLGTLAGPLSMMPAMFGGDLARTAQRSQHLYADLEPPRQGNLLGWLNAQAHPDIRWTSIIHTGASGQGADGIVDAYSQDLNRVAALQGKAATRVLSTDHELGRGDAALIARLLQ